MSASPIPVVLVAHEFQVRGSSAYTLRLVKRLPALGFAPIVVTSDAERINPEARQGTEFREYSFLETPLVSGVVAWLAGRDLRRHPPALVHIQSRRVIPQGLTLARVLGVPVVTTIHDYVGPHETLDLDCERCHSVIAVSNFVRDGILSAVGERVGGIDLIYSGVDIPEESDELEILPPHRVPVIGTAGPLELSKGFEFFLNAAAEVLKSGREVEFLIAGSGPDEGRLRETARRLKITEHVTFISNMKDFAGSLRAIDVFCLTSLVQGLGTIMLEAMAMARPVIATDVGGVGQIVTDGVTGLSVPAGECHRLAERMLELLDNPLRAKAIGRAGRNVVIRDFNADRMVEETVRIYRRALNAMS